MIIFDTENNYNNQIKGVLHLNLMDIEFLLTKYSKKELESSISTDYLEHFYSELAQIKKNKINSIEYYGRVNLRIENEQDEKLLEIITKEIEAGNLFTKKYLSSITKEELIIKIEELEKQENLSIGEIYKLRSYKLSEFITKQIEEANYHFPKAQEEHIPYSIEKYKEICEILKAIGITSEIVESDYFDSQKQKMKTNLPYIIKSFN